MTNCLVFDLGAGSGRAMVAQLGAGRISFAEVHRFSGIETRLPDGPHWDFARLLNEVETGIRLAFQQFGSIGSIGVDSWGVDYVLVDADGQLDPAPYHYRHPRSHRGYESFPIAPSELFSRTGAQILPVNTVYQLISASKDEPDRLSQSRYALMIADAVNFHLTGKARANTTLARTSGLLSLAGEWDGDLCKIAGIEPTKLSELVEPGEIVGVLSETLADRRSGSIPVVAVAAHDTASAICGLPLEQDDAFLICGSWSILGREVDHQITTVEAHQDAFGNECGVDGRYAFLRSLNGLHLLQKLRASWNHRNATDVTFADMSAAARDAAARGVMQAINPSDAAFFDSDDLVGTIVQIFPELRTDLGSLTLCVYRGLVEDITQSFSTLSRLTGDGIEKLRICGGGGQDALLCQMISDRLGCEVHVGPIEASAWGNAILQLKALGQITSLDQGRELARLSGGIVVYRPDRPSKN